MNDASNVEEKAGGIYMGRTKPGYGLPLKNPRRNDLKWRESLRKRGQMFNQGEVIREGPETGQLEKFSSVGWTSETGQ